MNTSQYNRILILSQRKIDLKVYQCWAYEFEDVISEVDKVDLLILDYLKLNNIEKKIRLYTNRVHRLIGLKKYSETFICNSIIDNEYDIFFAVFTFPTQILYLNSNLY